MIVALSGYLARKCQYEDKIDNLTHAEQTVYFVTQLEEEEINRQGLNLEVQALCL